LGAEDGITYYSNNFGYSHLNPSSHNGISNPIASAEKNLNNHVVPSNPKFANPINQNRTPPPEMPRDESTETPNKLKPIQGKTIRINGVDVQINSQARNYS
jgi:hypothetical protein